MSYGTITLASGEELFGGGIDAGDSGWWIDGNVVTVRDEHGLTVWRLPRGRAKLSLRRLGKSRGQLIVAGFTKVTVVVNGPYRALEKLMEEL